MVAGLWTRIAREIGLGLLAIAAAAVVLLPGTWLIDRLFREGEYALLIVSVVVGAAILAYQARLRPALREPVQRVASSLADAFGTSGDGARRTVGSLAAFRAWGGVPIASLRVASYGGLPPGSNVEAFCASICEYVRARAETSGALTWAMREVGGDRVLLLQEPELGEEPLTTPRRALRGEETYRHLWSANGPASYEQPVAFATAVRLTAIAGKEAALYEEAVRVAGAAANTPDVAGVEVLLNEAGAGGRPSVLLLAAGVDRGARRRVYRALESSELAGLAASEQRFDLIACDALAPVGSVATTASI